MITATYQTPRDQYGTDWDWTAAAMDAWTAAADAANIDYQVVTLDTDDNGHDVAIVQVDGAQYLLTVPDASGDDRDVIAQII